MLHVGDFYLEGLSMLFSIMTTVDYLDQDFAITFDCVHNGRGNG
jgi:hypothetical protein